MRPHRLKEDHKSRGLQVSQEVWRLQLTSLLTGEKPLQKRNNKAVNRSQNDTGVSRKKDATEIVSKTQLLSKIRDIFQRDRNQNVNSRSQIEQYNKSKTMSSFISTKVRSVGTEDFLASAVTTLLSYCPPRPFDFHKKSLSKEGTAISVAAICHLWQNLYGT